MREHRIQFMNPTVQADFVAVADDALCLFRMQKRSDRGDEERGRHAMFAQHVKNARHARPATVLAPTEAADRLSALAQLAGFVVAIE